MADPPRVAVVVLCWNGAADTLTCLRSLHRSTMPGLDIVVVDNGSTDDTVRRVRDSGLAHALVENGENLGFAAGNNIGIALALERGASAVLVLNNDTIVTPNAVEALVAAMLVDDRVGACSPVLPFADDVDRLWFAGAPYDPDRARSGRSSAFERGARLPDAPIAIDRAAGAAMLVRRQTIEEVGVFADDLFYLHEDVDWSLRMRAAGWQVLLVPAASIAHRVAASQCGNPVTPTTAYYGTRNDLAMGRRHGRGGARRQILCTMVHLAQVRRAPAGSRLATMRATIEGARDHRRGRLGKRPVPG